MAIKLTKKKLKACLDKIVTDLQSDIILIKHRRRKLTDEDRTGIGICVKMISSINREFGTTYKTATLGYSSNKKHSYDYFLNKFPIESRKGYMGLKNNQ